MKMKQFSIGEREGERTDSTFTKTSGIVSRDRARYI